MPWLWNDISHHDADNSYHVIQHITMYINGLVQDCSISIANALEILQSCTKASICWSWNGNASILVYGNTILVLFIWVSQAAAGSQGGFIVHVETAKPRSPNQELV